VSDLQTAALSGSHNGKPPALPGDRYMPAGLRPRSRFSVKSSGTTCSTHCLIVPVVVMRRCGGRRLPSRVTGGQCPAGRSVDSGQQSVNSLSSLRTDDFAGKACGMTTVSRCPCSGRGATLEQVEATGKPAVRWERRIGWTSTATSSRGWDAPRYAAHGGGDLRGGPADWRRQTGPPAGTYPCRPS